MRLRVIAPARLHFGLLQIDPSQPHCYGGIGLMLNHPQLIVSCTTTGDDTTSVEVSESIDSAMRSELTDKVLKAYTQAISTISAGATRSLRFTIESAPRLHTGLGTGTQLACSVATLVHAFSTENELKNGRYHSLQMPSSQIIPAYEAWAQSLYPQASPHDQLAIASGRGKRSHIGLEGFLCGGWIFDQGICFSESKSTTGRKITRVQRYEFPSNWQILLFTNDQDQGLSGEKEQASFDKSQFLKSDIPSLMLQLANTEIHVAINNADFERFANAIRRYNQLAGDLFLNAHPDPRTATAMQKIGLSLEKYGIKAFGQTSWGPTIWAIVPETSDHENQIRGLKKLFELDGLEHIQIQHAEVNFTGAMLQLIQE